MGSCIASGSWSGDKPTSGSESVVVAVEGSNEFVLECNGPNGVAIATTTVTGEPAITNPPPTIDDQPDRGAGGGALASLSILLLALASIWRVISARFVHAVRCVTELD